MLEMTMHFAISIALKGLSQFYNSTGSQGIYAVFIQGFTSNVKG